MTDKRKLNKEQVLAVTHGNGPLLIIAGAGTGKTTVVTERIKYLILKRHVLPSQILALTFTEKAAREMEERIDIAMPYGYTDMWIATFHAFCGRILRSEVIHIGLTPSYALTTETEAILFLRKHLFMLDLDYFRPLGNPHKFLQGLLQHFSRLKDEDISPSEYLRWAQSQKSKVKSQNDKDEIKKNLELAHAYQKYEELKIKEGVMDFSDLISNTLKLFRTRKNILRSYQDQFTYILVDEFQDTNYAQNQLAILLAGEQKNITVVGDDDQAIYRWRGAAISNIIQFRKHFPKAKVVTLTENYRSTKEILQKSYLLIQQNNPDRLEVKENVNKKLTSVRKVKGEPVELLFAERVEDEAELAVNKIKELVNNYRYKDIAILVRANDHALPFVRSLQRANIPYQFLGPGQLFHQEEIKDLIAYIKVLYNFEDTASLYRVLTMPIFQLQGETVASLLNFTRKNNITLFETLKKTDKTNLEEFEKEKIKTINDMLKRHLQRVPKDTAGEILYYLLKDSGMLKKMLDTQTEQDEKKSKNIAKFFDKLKTYEVEHEDASVFAIVDWIDLAMQMGESPLASDRDWTENNAVNILTVHSSKGLEFPCIFLVNLVSQKFPVRERKEQIPIPQDLVKEIFPVGDYHMQEERRLFYVGMTRARDRLFLTAAKYYGEGKRERKISPFVSEALGENVINQTIKEERRTKNQLSLLDWDTKESEKSQSTPGNTPLTITYLSYSQIQTFDICPLHYKLRYIIKIPTPQSASQSFGSSVHSVLRDFYGSWIKGEKLHARAIDALLEKDWINEGYESKKHEKMAFKKAHMILTQYIHNNLPNKSLKPIALELPFKFFLEDSAKKLTIGGRIDRIDDLGNGTIEILDYKTGKNIPSEKELAENQQLTFYALAATEIQDTILAKKPEDVILSLYYLEEKKKLTTTRTKEQLEEAKTWILQKAKEIAESDFACSKSVLCVNCEYKMLCNTH